MMNWARYLRSDGKNRGCEILDISSRSLDESGSYIVERPSRPFAVAPFRFQLHCDGMTYGIRAAAIEDRDAVEAIVRAAYAPYVPRIGRDPGPMLDDYAALIANGRVHVIEHGGTVRGVLVLIPEKDALLLDNVAVAPEVQGWGLGGRLLAFAEQAAIRSGYRSIRLYTNEAMTENIALYSRKGFSETHRGEEKGFRRVYMSKSLNAAVSFRRAEDEDAELVQEVVQSAYSKWISTIGREPTPMTVDYNKAVREHDIDLAIEGVVVGLIETWLQEDHLWIENVAVHPDRQGVGIGRALLAHADGKAAQARLGEIRLQTNEAFEANIALYAALGYAIDRREPFRGGTTLFMSKKLIEEAEPR